VLYRTSPRESKVLEEGNTRGKKYEKCQERGKAKEACGRMRKELTRPFRSQRKELVEGGRDAQSPPKKQTALEISALSMLSRSALKELPLEKKETVGGVGEVSGKRPEGEKHVKQ